MILWMVYTCNVKGLEEVEKLGRNECTLHCWRISPARVIAVDHTSKFKIILSMLNPPLKVYNTENGA